MRYKSGDRVTCKYNGPGTVLRLFELDRLEIEFDGTITINGEIDNSKKIVTTRSTNTGWIRKIDE